MQSNNNHWLDETSERIHKIINNNKYKRTVLQFPKDKINQSFALTQMLKKDHPQTRFFTLFDTMKKSCCVDILGAEHVNYDCLIHFGEACFSSPNQDNHYFMFDHPQKKRLDLLRQFLESQKFKQSVLLNNVGYIIVDQSLYESIHKIVNQNINISQHIKVLKLQFEATQQEQYLTFGYYINKKRQNIKSVLIIEDQKCLEEQKMSLLEKISFSFLSISDKVGQDLFTINFKASQLKIQKFEATSSKKLMQRYSMISQLEKHQVFGLIVSNTSTSFFKTAIERAKNLLKKANKRCFIFMMNNLNEVKLGNFPEIEVYVVISCFNNILFSVKEFFRLVVTPVDLEVAFGNRQFSNYNFDLSSEANTKQKEIQVDKQSIAEQEQAKKQNFEIDLIKNKQVMLQNKIQTLDYYRGKEYKGLDFSDKKQVKKMTKGKIGLAEQYKALE